MKEIKRLARNKTLSLEEINQIYEFADLVLCQLCFTGSFVEDLLNLRMISQNSLEIVKDQFNPQKVLNSVIKMFSIKARMQ